MDWLRKLLDADEGDGGGGGGDDGGGDVDGGAASGSTPNVMEMSLGDGDDIPEKFRGKTVADVLKSGLNAEKLVGKKEAALAKLQEQMAAKPAGDGHFDPDAFKGLIDTGRVAGEVKPEDLAAVAGMLGIESEELGEVIQFVHTKYTGTLAKAQEQLDATYVDDDGEARGIQVQALLEYVNENEVYSAEDLAMFNKLLKRGSIEPFKLIIEDLEKAGISPETLKGGKPGGESAADRLPNPLKGRIQGVEKKAGFDSREEYVNARLAAENSGDPAKVEAVEKMLRQSKIDKWTDRRIIA